MAKCCARLAGVKCEALHSIPNTSKATTQNLDNKTVLRCSAIKNTKIYS